MKIIYAVCTIFCLLLFNSCKSNSNPTDSGGIGGIGGGGGGSVTFTITTEPGTTGIFFDISPSAAITIKTINVSLPAQNLSDPFTGDGTTVFPANKSQRLNQEYNGVATGQKWVFVITGNLGTSTGADFNVTTNYTIP